jgi:hypothetical protein
VPGRGSGYPPPPPTDPDVSNSLIRFVSSHRLAWVTPFTRQWLTQGCAHRLGRITMLHPALCYTCVDTSYGLKVPLVVPHSRTLCPASPSLRWVPCASVPHLLELDFASSSVLCSATTANSPSRVPSLSLVPRYPASPLSFVSHLIRLARQAGVLPPFARALVYRQYPFL